MMNGNYRCNSHNEKAKIAESYNALYSYFSSDEIKQVGNYTIVKFIGEGAFGKVYLATHNLTHTKVVLKTGLKDDPNIVREVFYHRQFKHPHITRLYEVVVADGKIWMVLEYCPGKELYDYVLSCRRVDIDEVRKFFAQIAGAVYYAHSLNCIHRDLKLENILLDKKRNAKLSDFGFTREYESRSLLETVCGTTVYMAPELLEKKKYDGFKVDIWSLGIILYTLLYGEMPFEEDDDLKTQFKIINDEPVYKTDISSEAIDLIQKLLNKVPHERPTMTEILNHPFLDSIGPSQLDTSNSLIKKLTSSKTFDSKTEKYLLKKLKSIGIDTSALKKSVLTNSCDSLAGLWELLLEKQRKSEAKKYKARSRSVLRISESTSRRVSQFMEGSPAISRIVSQRSINTTGGGSSSAVPLSSKNYYASSIVNSIANSITNTPTVSEKKPNSGEYFNANGSIISSPEKKKNGFMSKISKLWKKKDNNNINSDNLYIINSRDSYGSRVDSPVKQTINPPINSNNNRRISFSFQSNKKQNLQEQNHVIQENEELESELSPTQSLNHPQISSFQKPNKQPALDQRLGNSSSTILEQIQQQEAQQQQPIAIKEPKTPTYYMNGRSSTRPRPTSVLSQHSLMSQLTAKSDISLASNTTTRSDSRPPFTRKLSGDASLNSKGGNSTKRSLSLISSNSSTSERSSRRSSLYENSPTTGRSTITEFKLKNTLAPTRGRRTYNEGAIFPRSFRRKKSPLGSALLSGSKFKRSKTLIIEEDEEDTDFNNNADGESVYEEEDMDALETDLENLEIAESTRKSSDFESDLNEERGRQMQR